MAARTPNTSAKVAEKAAAKRVAAIPGIEGQGWFLNFHCFAKYLKIAFFRGTSLRPLPPGESKHKEVRYLHIHEDDQHRRLTRADVGKTLRPDDDDGAGAR